MTAKALKHRFVSAVGDATDATQVRPSNWNDDHNIWLGTRSVSTTSDTIINADHLTIIRCTNAAATTLALAAPSSGNMPAGWAALVRSHGSGPITFNLTGGATINGSATVGLNPNESLALYSDGTSDYSGVLTMAPTSPGMAAATFAQIGMTGATNASLRQQFQISAQELIVRDSAGRQARITNTGTITCDCSVAGPALNGRDQAAAFTNGWIHFYWIYNRVTATLGTIASTVAPPTGPTVPSGYTYLAYIGAIKYDATGSTFLALMDVRDNWFFYRDDVYSHPILNGGTSGSEVSIDASPQAPPNARECKFFYEGISAATGTPSAASSAQAEVRNTSGAVTGYSQFKVWYNRSQWEQMSNAGEFNMAVVQAGPTFYYGWSVAPGSALYLYIIAYRIANGAQ